MNTTALSTIVSLILLFAASGCSRAPQPSQTYQLDPSKPQFTLARVDLAAPPKVETFRPSSGKDRTFMVHLRMGAAKADAFRQFTRDHKNQQTQFVVGTEVIAEPFVAAEIQDGRFDIDFSSLEEARRVRYLLTKR